MIRTEDEFRSATTRLDQEMMIARTRSLTDDEQRSLDALTQEIGAYRAGRSTTSPTSRSPAPAPTASLPSTPPAATSTETPNATSLAAASMRRELARNRIEPAAHTEASPTSPTDSVGLSAASMEREIKRAGLRRVA